MAQFLLASWSVAALSGASDAFVGAWKLNMAKSKFSGYRYKIEDLGQNRYKLAFDAEPDIITANGTDQPVHYGNTMSLTRKGPNVWVFVSKKDGRVLESYTDTLSADGKTITFKGVLNKPDGSSGDVQGTWNRVGSGSGWAGTWESSKIKVSAPDEFVISSYEGEGLSFNTPAYKDVLNIKFDGKEYVETGPNVASGSTSSGKRVDGNTVELTDRVQGKVTDRTKVHVSQDAKTLTITMFYTGQDTPQIAVFDKK
jgi:hypothetical protein